MSKYFIFIVAFFLIVIETNAQESKLELDESVDKYIDALGGRQRLQSVHSMKMTGLHFYRGLEQSLTILCKRPNLFRVEITNENGKRVSIFDGETAWEMTDEAPAREIQDPRSKIFMDINDDFESALIGYKAKGHEVEFSGIENIDGKSVYKLHLKLSNGRLEDWYIDRSSFLLLKRATTYKRRNREFGHDLFFMDYKKLNGIMIPHYIERVFEPHYVRGYEITKVEINPELKIELFQAQSVSEKSSN